jgi:hypothetical protein
LQTTYLDCSVELIEENHVDSTTGENFVRIVSPSGGVLLDVDATMRGPITGAMRQDVFGERKDLVFVPYYFRSNRGGGGQSRVGLGRY